MSVTDIVLLIEDKIALLEKELEDYGYSLRDVLSNKIDENDYELENDIHFTAGEISSLKELLKKIRGE